MTWEGIPSFEEKVAKLESSNAGMQANFAKIVELADIALDAIPYSCNDEYCPKLYKIDSGVKCYSCAPLDTARKLICDIKALSDIQDISS